MTTLYKPVLIESAEQAEALPDGTLATDPGVYAAEKDGDLWLGHLGPWPSSLMVGRTALVPIEAKEETRSRDVTPTLTLNDPRWSLDRDLVAVFVTETRLVTPWEAE